MAVIWSLTQDHQHKPGSCVGSEIGVDASHTSDEPWIMLVQVTTETCGMGWDPIVRVITS